MKFWRQYCLLAFFCISVSLSAHLSYKVEYLGIDSTSTLKTIKSIAQLNTLQKLPPDSMQALRYRAESDIPEILKVLHAQGYYEAQIEIQIEERPGGAIVFVVVHLGPAYAIGSFTVRLSPTPDVHPVHMDALSASHLGIRIGSRAQAIRVINAELFALQRLSEQGYPLASVTDRKMVADGDTKSLDIQITIDPGPLTYFGPWTLSGNSHVKRLFFEQRLDWKEGEIYSSRKVEETQKNLTDTGLFSSVTITHADTWDENHLLPMHIDISENKHASIYAGISYQTYYGPGVTFGWEHRNIQGLGRKLSLQGDITKRSHVGTITYLIPNFVHVHQDYVWQGKANFLHILPYHERSYQLSNRLERRFSKQLRMAFGGEGERLFVESSVQNGDYWILNIPIFLGLNRSNSLLDPTSGMNLEYRAIPSFAFSPDRSFYCTHKVTIGTYIPVTKEHTLSIAQKFSAATILSEKEADIPVARRLFGGSEEDLRGYAYYSVSPLNTQNKPTGGRSALYYTLEMRIRMTKTIGLVPFLDTGNVSKKQCFIPEQKWRKSLGVGLRYFSFIGPFRLDVGFPLNPRKGIDSRYRILISVGQSF